MHRTTEPMLMALKMTCVWTIGLLIMAGWGVDALCAAEEDRALVVSQLHPAASDDNPGTADRPFKTISCAARQVQPGDVIQIEDGVYREAVVVEVNGVKERPIMFVAAPGAHVVVTGADVVTEWQREPGDGNRFSAPWPHVFAGWSPSNAHPNDDEHRLIGRCEQVFTDGYPLQQVLSLPEMSRGTFFADLQTQRLYVWDRMNRDPVHWRQYIQAAARQVVWESRGAHIHVRGIRFRYAANQAQRGAVLLTGNYGLLEDCVVEQVNSSGVSIHGTGVVVRRCVFRDNGQLGFNATCTDLLITECICENNNVKNFSREWEAGGNKLVLCKNAVIERSTFRNNHGNGIWFDIGNEDCTVRNCLIMDNEDAGIFYEISYRLDAHDNVILRNGFSPRHRQWGANGGISLSSSAGCQLARNLLVGNKEGLQFRDQVRVTNRIGRGENFAIWNRDHHVHHNLIAWNRDLQTGGWFDLADESHWLITAAPAALSLTAAEQDELQLRPAGLSLSDLRFNLHDNIYATKPGQLLYQWGCPWHRHDKLSVEEVQQKLGLEADSSVFIPQFANWSTLDFRLPANNPIVTAKCYPQGEVPGVKLGTLEIGDD